jgi:hypothetical protein
MNFNWLVYPAIFAALFVVYCYAMRRYTGAQWGEIVTLGLHNDRALKTKERKGEPLPPTPA